MFQKSIIEKYLSKLDTKLLHEKYELFCANYKNETKIANIRALKEEQYQEGFIRDVFCSVLNYTIKPEPDYNILTELKNETKNKNNARKSDGAICEENDESRVRAVIELKGTDTTDLDTVARQAFDYKSHHENCNYAIVCNFERLRLYVETQIEFVEFNLFKLTFEDFCLLYLLLELNQLKNDIPLKLKHETLSEEKQITDNFYSDYSTFKRCLFEDMIENNPTTDKLVLFKKTQKLLDRILFVLFCEDRGLLPANSVMGIIGDYHKLKEMGYGQPLYSVFKTYFGRIDKGYKSESDSTKSIFAYNGGLFKPDEILDNLKVGDDVLFIHSKRLSDYDFESQISVDILGRIFENSLTEIEEVQKEIEAEKSGEKVENNNVGKRKKDGVFYTPEYITKYIVENTIGKLCEQKREELNISDEAVSKAQTKKQKDSLNAALHEYQKWLFGLKILDPACGSGAFLTAALTQLKTEHRRVFDFLHAINNDTMMFDEYSDNSILENNLYGVDINEESVEITKLSLWLHTAQKDRKLTTLNNKIKCGNSLIDDPAIAGEKAFDWEKEFPEVFCRSEGNKGGFDVVIGNPPYVLCQISNTKERLLDYYKSFEVASYKIDLFHLFFEKGISLLNENGLLGYISPNTYFTNKYIKSLRHFILKNTDIVSIVNYETDVFSEAKVDTATIILNKKKKENNIIEVFSSSSFSKIDKIADKKQNDWVCEPDNIFNIKKETVSLASVKSVELGSICNTYFGIQAFDRKSSISTTKNDENYYEIIDGEDVLPFSYSIPKKYFNFIPENIKSGGDWKIYQKDRIVIRQIGKFPIVGFSKANILASNTIYSIYTINEDYSLLYILCILNSAFIKNYWLSKYSDSKQLFPKIKGYQLKELPIPEIPLSEQQPFIALADKMLTLNETLQKKSSNFLKVVKQTFTLEKISTKLETFYDLDFDGFMKELKQKVTPKTKLEWLEIFEDTKKQLQELQTQITATDKQINTLVYKLYDLTEEEIKIVEGR
ncbi:TaqI-like C-terminal specificity domain-containing protein [Treponema berlinense]|uniref:Eco57I restriction-modification methylase domain-containing protein n=1 Tax=Treponema berlinense TaxID=225004 RepID=UPI0026EB2319|nr:TaqI-like C-terminal specificity domain-containing protein [Treponema berlinense]